jgi:lipoate synthase
MVGLGEETHELLDVFHDLAATGCDILTIGQYLRPSRDHLPMARLYTPREFAELKTEALQMGFRHVESGRSCAQATTRTSRPLRWNSQWSREVLQPLNSRYSAGVRMRMF